MTPTQGLFALVALAGATMAFAQDASDSRMSKASQQSASDFIGSASLRPNNANRTGGSIQALSSSPGRLGVVYTNIATSPTSLVPGLGGARFGPGSVTTAFDRPEISPDGLHLAFAGDSDLATSIDDILIADGVVVAREAQAAPFAPGFNFGASVADSRLGINNSGECAFATITSENSTANDYVVKVGPGLVYTVAAKEAGPIAAPAGATWDDSVGNVSMLADGRVALLGTGIDGAVTTATDAVAVIGATLVAQKGVTVPAGQAGGGTETWQAFDFSTVDERYQVTPDGLHYVLQGDLGGATTNNDDVVVYDGTVVLQEGQIIPGSGFTTAIVTTAADGAYVDNAGNWYARGNNSSADEDWAVRNGTVFARTDAPIGDSGERILLTGTMNQANESTPSGAPGTGTIAILIDTASNTLTYDITHTGLAPGVESMAHIHGPAPAGVDAAVLYALPVGAAKSGRITYLESEENWFLTGQTYVNVHTDLVPTGAIRGQNVQTPERWDDADFADCFFLAGGNAVGDYFVGGVTNAPSLANGVIVLYPAGGGQPHVVVRESDPVDVDGNGMYDDNTFVSIIGNDDTALADDETMYSAVQVKDGTDVNFGQVILKRDPGTLMNSYCYGDGSGTACPCGNNSPVGQNSGCMNSQMKAAKLDASGMASISNDTLKLLGTDMPNSSALYFQGTNDNGGGLGTTFGDGLRCVAGTVRRLPLQTNVGFASMYPGIGNNPITIPGAITVPGSVRYYQIWYRNGAVGFCTIETYNLSNGVRVVWGP